MNRLTGMFMRLHGVEPFAVGLCPAPEDKATVAGWEYCGQPNCYACYRVAGYRGELPTVIEEVSK